MKRIHLFEVEDLSWFPKKIREYMTLYLVMFHRKLKTSEVIAPLIEKALGFSSEKNVIDLCSGGGGPMLDIADELRKKSDLENLTLTLTDLYPHQIAAQKINEGPNKRNHYLAQSVNAAKVDPSLKGVRTMICSFHHMTPEIGTSILQDAAKSRQPFLAFEISDNSAPFLLWWTSIPVGILLSLIFMPNVRPFSLGQFVFTYLIPILPLTIGWDGSVSNARTYTEEDLREILSRIDSKSYHWEIGKVKKKNYPAQMIYLLGTPV